MIALREFGSYHVGGRRVTVHGHPRRLVELSKDLRDVEYDPNGNYWVEQAYVQYFVPAVRSLELPLVLVHGGGLCGAAWETTPDCRPGWLQRFIGKGIACYVVDNAERGRAGFCALPGLWTSPPITRSAEEAWNLFRFGTRESYPGRVPYPGQRFPIWAFDRLVAQIVPRWTTNRAIQVAALEAAISSVGQCYLLCHSQGGDLALDIAVRRPDIVRGVVSIEPTGLPDGLRVGQAVGQRYLFLFGDFVELYDVYRMLLDKSVACCGALAAAGADAQLIYLPRAGISGNSHMMMMDNNSDQLLSIIESWLREFRTSAAVSSSRRTR